MLGRQGGKCAFWLMRLTKCKDVFEVLVFQMRIQIRMAKTKKLHFQPFLTGEVKPQKPVWLGGHQTRVSMKHLLAVLCI